MQIIHAPLHVKLVNIIIQNPTMHDVNTVSIIINFVVLYE